MTAVVKLFDKGQCFDKIQRKSYWHSRNFCQLSGAALREAGRRI